MIHDTDTHADQEYFHPAWKVCIGMAILFFVVIAYGGRAILDQQSAIDENADNIEELEDFLEIIYRQQKQGEERSYITRAIAGCSDIINDGEIEVTSECTDPRVAMYYAPSICAKLPVEIDGCGSKAAVVTG